MKKAILAIVFAASILAEENKPDITSLVNGVDSECFDERERCTSLLSALPEEYADTLLRMSFAGESMEAKYRLYQAAKAIFMSKIIRKDEGWLRMHGFLGVNITHVEDRWLRAQNRRKEKEKEDTCKGDGSKDDDQRSQSMFVEVTYPETDAEAKLKRGDIIESIDGRGADYAQIWNLVPGREYKIVVMRPKNEPKENEEYVFGLYPEDYERLEISVRAAWVDQRTRHKSELVRIAKYEDEAWKKFVDVRREDLGK